MNRSGLYILLLSLSFYVHGMDEEDPEKEPTTQEKEKQPPTTSSTNDQSDFNPFDQETSADTSSQSTLNPSPLSSSPSLFSVSTKTEKRSWLSSLLRWGNKQIGMTADLAGLGTLEEKKRTQTILNQCAQVLLANNAQLSPDLQKQCLERIIAIDTLAFEIISLLQIYNAEKKEEGSNISIVTQKAQTLLEMHKDTTLPPMLTQALEAQLKMARATLNPTPPSKVQQKKTVNQNESTDQ